MYVLIGILIALTGWYVFEKRKRPTHPVAPGLNLDISLPHDQEWEIYQNQISLCSKKLRVCMEELGLSYQSHHVELIETGRYENLGRDFLKINPSFTVPVLVHNGHPVYESHEQIVYAAEHSGPRGKELLGRTPELRNEVSQWVDNGALKGDPIKGSHERAGNAAPGLTMPIFASMVAYIPWWRIAEGLLFHGDRKRPLLFSALKMRGLHRIAPPLQKIIQRSRRDMDLHLDKLEEALSHGRDWLTGDTFTLADVSWMALLERIDEVDWSNTFFGEGRHPLVKAYWERLKLRHSYKTALSHRGAIHTRALEDLRKAKEIAPELRESLEVS